MTRFVDWVLDHPWLFLVGYIAAIVSVSGLLFIVYAPFGIGFLAGAGITIPRLVWQSYGIWRDNKNWEAYLRGERQYR